MKKFLQNYRNFKVFTVLVAVLLAVALIVVVRLVMVLLENAEADRGYRDLRQFAPDDVYMEQYIDSGPEQLIYEPQGKEYDDDEEDPEPPPGMILEPGPELADINENYAGWIRIEGTPVDYPMVQSDNVKYLNTTFWGSHNRAGTIFLDERNTGQFNGTFVVAYGHNSRSGGMFGSLRDFARVEHKVHHPDITIFTRNGEVLTYRIIAAFATTINDDLYALFDADEETKVNYFMTHGAHSYSTNFLALSTCIVSNSDDDRFLVLAAR